MKRNIVKGVLVTGVVVMALITGALIGVKAFLTATGISTLEAKKLLNKENERLHKALADCMKELAQE